MGNTALAAVLRDRWNGLRVEQVGVDNVAVIDPGEDITLLRIVLPDELRDDVKAAIPDDEWQRYFPVLYKFGIGPDDKKAPESAVPSAGG
jgi:hypothetical protein